jgi:hypothetical protein
MTSFYSSKHERSSVDCAIEFILDLSTKETFEGFIENISEAGFCLITSTPLEKDQEIIIKTDIFLPSHSAYVCWVEKRDDDLYRVGMKFTK